MAFVFCFGKGCAFVSGEYKTKEQKRKFYDSQYWKKLRKVIKERDNFRMPGM